MTSSWVCEEPGCGVGPATGGSLLRTSPKGEPFRGRCPDHMRSGVDAADDVVVEIVNLISTGKSGRDDE